MNHDIVKEVLYYENLSLPVFLLVLTVAFILGAIHALGPGHGKSLMAAYLIGSTGRIRDAIVLAMAITLSHVFSVIVIGLVALWLADFFWPETISKWLGLFSGIAIFAIGLWLLITRYKMFKQKTPGRNFTLQKVHTHNSEILSKIAPFNVSNAAHHSNSDTQKTKHFNHHHPYDPNASIWSNIALGISGGIIPCPKAIVILLLAISLQKIAFGIIVILAFSFGISFVLVALGIIMVKATYLLKGRFEDKRVQILPIVGAVVIVGLGVVLTVRTIAIL